MHAKLLVPSLSSHRFRVIGWRLFGTALLMMSLAGPASAIDYVIEVVLFENLRTDSSARAGDLIYPKIKAAIGLNSEAAIKAEFALVDSELLLTEHAEKMSASGKYRILKHFAWRQPGLDQDDARPIRINVGSTLPVYIPDNVTAFDHFIPASAQADSERPRQVTTTTVNGTLKIRLGRFLHMETILVFTDTDKLQSFRLSQSRKMRSRELHYIDNPRFGILTKIVPIDEDNNPG